MDTKNRMPATPVDRLLRCRKTQRYFNGGGWTINASQAKTFPNQFEAIRECLQLADVELVLRAPGGGADLFTTGIC